ncbi:hypothetical protein V1511DRAFT_508979 [Dipodascopsis uninucleata]
MSTNQHDQTDSMVSQPAGDSEVPLDPDMLYATSPDSVTADHDDIVVASALVNSEVDAVDSHLNRGANTRGYRSQNEDEDLQLSNGQESAINFQNFQNGGRHESSASIATALAISSIPNAIGSSSITSTEEITVFHCPVPMCSMKTYAKRGRRAILRHLKSRTDHQHVLALSRFSRKTAPMTKQERSRKTSATYREKHQQLSEQRAREAGEPYLAPLYNPVLVKKHEAYVRKKIKAALDIIAKPQWPAAPGQTPSDAASTTLLQHHLHNMETNVLWILQELDNSVYFPSGADIASMMARDGGEYYRRRLRELEERFPDRSVQIRQAMTQLDDQEALERASVEFQVWKKHDDLARAKRQLDRERYERECEEAIRRIEEYERERTEEGIEGKVQVEMMKWRERMTQKLRQQWRQNPGTITILERSSSPDDEETRAMAVAAESMGRVR